MRPLYLLVLLTLTLSIPGHAEDGLMIEPYAGKLRQVTVTIADGQHKFLFDTGGGYTLISPEVARVLGCVPRGRIVGFRMTGERFETPLCPYVRYAAGVSRIETVGVFDLMALLPQGMPRVEGVVSLLTFAGKRLALDLRSNRITFGAGAGGTPFPCRVATGLDGSNYVLFAGIRRGQDLFWFEVDSGNVDAVRMSPHVGTAFGLSPSNSDTAIVEILLGTTTPAAVQARVADIIYDGVLGAEFLEQGILHADLRGAPSCRWEPHRRSAQTAP